VGPVQPNQPESAAQHRTSQQEASRSQWGPMPSSWDLGATGRQPWMALRNGTAGIGQQVRRYFRRRASRRFLSVLLPGRAAVPRARASCLMGPTRHPAVPACAARADGHETPAVRMAHGAGSGCSGQEVRYAPAYRGAGARQGALLSPCG
jgi:hypothetical protein